MVVRAGGAAASVFAIFHGAGNGILSWALAADGWTVTGIFSSSSFSSFFSSSYSSSEYVPDASAIRVYLILGAADNSY